MFTEDSHTTQIHVILADDHDILRQGLKLLLEAQPDIQVIGEARTGTEAIEQTKQHAPDVIILDISMPDMDGLKACQVIRQHYPETQVLILTMHESEEYFLQALRVGAVGYLVKKAAPSELCAAVRTTAQGGAFLYPGLAKTLIRAYLTNQHSRPGVPAASSSRSSLQIQALSVLTPREIEVLKLVAEGNTSQEIADRLVLSVKTVQAHRANIMEKLELRDIAHLVRFAIHHGLIPPEP
jgi:DNA-binding NarL/FixJ family response regulator